MELVEGANELAFGYPRMKRGEEGVLLEKKIPPPHTAPSKISLNRDMLHYVV